MKKLLPNQQFRWNTLLPKTAIWSNLHCHPVCSIIPFLQNYHSFLGVFSQSLLYSCPILTLASERPTFEVPLPPPPVWGMWKIPGQGSNLSHSNDNAKSSTARPSGDSSITFIIKKNNKVLFFKFITKEWLNKWQYIYTMEYLEVIKRIKYVCIY